MCLLDGAVVYENRGKHRHLPCFHNTYEIIAWEKTDIKKPLEYYIEGFISLQVRVPSIPVDKKRNHTFRVVTSVENNLISINGAVKTKVEKFISQRTGMTVERGGSGYEYWFLYRNEGCVFFMRRLTYPYNEIPAAKGELRPELVYLLNYLSRPTPDDI